MFRFALLSTAVAEQPSFEQWAADFGFNSADEDMKAKYGANVGYIEATNAQQNDFTLAVNQFSGLTLQEFQSTYTGEVDESEIPTQHVEMPKLNTAVMAVDWSTRSDIVNPVKNQGSCGSCWAFGAMGSLEPSWALATGRLYNLAEQQLVDCDTSSSGCSGGLSRYSFSGYLKTHGACTTSSYPYTARDGTCSDTSCSVAIPSGSILGYNQISATFSALKSALLNRPLKVSVYAESTFQSYSSGIAGPGACAGRTNHAVVAVGYGSGYIKIRNSWGTGWGEAGHIRVQDSSSCSTGTFDLFARTPIYPQLSTTELV